MPKVANTATSEKPTYHKGVRGGTYVLSTTGEKLYVPSKTSHWTRRADGRWTVHLSDGRSMLYPLLQ